MASQGSGESGLPRLPHAMNSGVPHCRRYFRSHAALVAGVMLFCSCSQDDPAKIKKTNDFIDKIDLLVAELRPTLPKSWSGRSTASDKYILWELSLQGLSKEGNRSTGSFLGSSTGPLWEARSLVIFDRGEVFDHILPSPGTQTPRAWIVDISTKSITGYYKGPTGRITVLPDGRTLADERAESAHDRFKEWFASVPKIINPINADAEASAQLVANAKDVAIGAFTLTVPTGWARFSPGEAAALRQQYTEQSKQIYQQFSVGDDPARSVAIASFHIASDDGAFIVVAFTVPPQSDLINLLKSQAKEKADFGIRQGYIRKYPGLVPVNDDQFSGFYIKTIGKSGNVEVSGGLEHKKLKTR